MMWLVSPDTVTVNARHDRLCEYGNARTVIRTVVSALVRKIHPTDRAGR